MKSNRSLDRLNPEQKKAVHQTEGKVLIIAGAGSGKTSVITRRIVHLIQQKNVTPSSILGLTFTNKAAEEMRMRIARLLNPQTARDVMLSTFHSFCMYILRREIHHLGFTKTFSLYDERDIKRMIGQLAKIHLEIEDPSSIITEVLEAKKMGIKTDKTDVQNLFQHLEISLRAYNAVDFDTLLSLTVELFEKFPSILEKYQKQFQYIMIDEYQDTSPVQDRLAHLLAKKSHNLCVVGDDDQAIYSWRGACIQNILSFKADHIIKLEQNYRSCQPILQAANAVIQNNQNRHKKWLISQKKQGDPLHIFHASDELEEASSIAERILYLKKEKNLKWKDIAILYRSNLLSKPFEMALMGSLWKKDGSWVRGIPYEIFGGTELYQRTEIKDLVAYLRVILNPFDGEALLRIINYPRRGISPKTLDQLTTINRTEKRSLWSVLLDVVQGKIENLTSSGIRGIQQFINLISQAKEDFNQLSLNDFIFRLLDRLELKRHIFEDNKDEKTGEIKWDNIQQFLLMLKNFETDSTSKKDALLEFLSSLTLQKPFRKQKNLDNDTVKLSTFHSSKGLEFSACFIIGLEDHIVPHEKGIIENSLEEERRLFYVALTRAKQYCTLSMARKRKKRGKDSKSSPSRFLYEIPKELLLVTGSKTITPFTF